MLVLTQVKLNIKTLVCPPPPFPRAKTKAVRNDDETIAVDVKLRKSLRKEGRSVHLLEWLIICLFKVQITFHGLYLGVDTLWENTITCFARDIMDRAASIKLHLPFFKATSH